MKRLKEYFLADGVSFCKTSDGVVFLDVRSDRYLGLPPEAAQNLLALVGGRGPQTQSQHELAEALLEKGLFTAERAAGQHISPTNVTCAPLQLIDSVFEDPIRIRLTDLIRFISACVSVAWSLRVGNLHSTLKSLRARKSRLARSGQTFDAEECRRLLHGFRYLRPLVYASRDHCLYDSLVLATYLRKAGLPTSCVFGVGTVPFRAHCWVQTERYVLNGVPAMLQAYVPILAV